MKKLIALLISLTMIFALCACGQTAEPKTEEAAKTDAPAADVAVTDAPVTLRLYTRYSDEDNIDRQGRAAPMTLLCLVNQLQR